MKHNHHNHCWHVIAKSNNGVLTSEVCCWCGERRIQSTEAQIPNVHGPNIPKPAVMVGPTEFKITNEMADDITPGERTIDKFMRDNLKGGELT